MIVEDIMKKKLKRETELKRYHCVTDHQKCELTSGFIGNITNWIFVHRKSVLHTSTL